MSNMIMQKKKYNQVVTCHSEDAHTKIKMKPLLEPYFICNSYELKFSYLRDFSYGNLYRS